MRVPQLGIMQPILQRIIGLSGNDDRIHAGQQDGEEGLTSQKLFATVHPNITQVD
jgi:hypothetical protein